jgi:protein SCO1/2
MLLTGCGGGIKNSFNWEIDDFKSINHEGEETRLSDFKGEVLIVDFIFTRCATVCIPMTANMTELQEKLKDEKLEAEIISISIDPDVDTPEILKEYVLGYDGDLSNWTLLTGYAQQFIEDYAFNNFKTAVKNLKKGIKSYMEVPFFLSIKKAT